MKKQGGFTIVELLVSMLIFAVVGLGLMGFTSSALQELGNQSRLSFATLELKNALSMLSSELRASSAISPYLPGNNTTLVNCTSSLSVSANSIRFLIAEDDSTATATAGIKPYYVGYSYNSTTGQLLRGEIPATSVTSCAVPAGDPNSSTYAKTLAEKVVTIDGDSNGTIDPVFSLSGNVLTVNLGAQVQTPGNDYITQQFRTRIYLRTN